MFAASPLFAVVPASLLVVLALALLVEVLADDALDADFELFEDADELFEAAEDEADDDADELALEEALACATGVCALSLDPDEPGLITNMASAPTAASAATTPTIGTAMLAALRRGVGLKFFTLCWPVPDAALRVAGLTVWVLLLFVAAPLSFDTCMAPHLMQNTAPSFNS